MKKKGTSGTQNVLGWEIFYYCSWRKFSVFHSKWQYDSAHRHGPVQEPLTPNGSTSLWNIGCRMSQFKQPQSQLPVLTCNV
jgi:hypothetical protein